MSLADLLAMAGGSPWQAKLAQGFEYSNSNYIALALIVERLSGRRIGEVISTDIIEPLGLSGTSMTAAGPAAVVHGPRLHRAGPPTNSTSPTRPPRSTTPPAAWCPPWRT